MLTGELRRQIDRKWDAFWSRGISNRLEVIEKIRSREHFHHLAFRGEL